MRATIISMVMRLPGSLPGMSVAGGLRPVRERGAVKPGAGSVSGPGQDCARLGLGRCPGHAHPTDASFSAPGDTRFASVTSVHIRRGQLAQIKRR